MPFESKRKVMAEKITTAVEVLPGQINGAIGSVSKALDSIGSAAAAIIALAALALAASVAALYIAMKGRSA